MGAACTQHLDAIKAQAMPSKPSNGKNPSSVPLTGQPFQRLKENFDAPYGETYECSFTKDDMGKLGLALITESGPTMQLLITEVKPGKSAHQKGVAPGTKIVAVNGKPCTTLDPLMAAKNNLGDNDSMSITFERPAWGYVVAKNGEFAGKPTVSTYKAMGLSYEDVPGKFGKSAYHQLTNNEADYFHEVCQRAIHLACHVPGWGKDGAARLFDAPYWEKACMDDAEFQSNFAKLKKKDRLNQAWCPMQCDEVGLPKNLSEMTHVRGDDERNHVPMSARFGLLDDCVEGQSELEYWNTYNKLNKMMDTIRYKSAASCNNLIKIAAKYTQKKVYWVPESDYQQVKKGLMKQYWEHEVHVTEDNDADLYVKRVSGKPSAEGEWQIVDNQSEADVCLYKKDPQYLYTAHFFIKYSADGEYSGLTPAGCTSGKMFYEQTHDSFAD
mmetsp:Transcript_14211/g.27630  ORF Transcript_14211/g.27630 Transcript_14211/m.27630 type:complete len:440 (+) Transcript_14211:46-1365(+)|eukprot:CAMPEP_0175139158 /NCGR_PEP_ID=MMETSP0087-20121206/10744_1 /TAXON_ID=136419 /ORGANISM="Unknown Unknown, Strain D1" /LENGTH=439 /DNA_ID=CAMNT_0016422131 /DNA_START=50 /DNA_END=1369 /DNA_ORIENTATION=-